MYRPLLHGSYNELLLRPLILELPVADNLPVLFLCKYHGWFSHGVSVGSIEARPNLDLVRGYRRTLFPDGQWIANVIAGGKPDVVSFNENIIKTTSKRTYGNKLNRAKTVPTESHYIGSQISSSTH